MIDVADLEFKSLKRTRKVNGERVIELDIFPTENNKKYFDLVVEESILVFDGDEYVIKQLIEQSVGETYWKQVTAVHKFYVDLINKQQPKIHNGSITFNNYMKMVFDDTDYSFEVIDQFNAREFENLGNDNRLALLQKGLGRFKAEFELIGSDYKARIRKQVGRDTDFQFRYGHNIKAITHNIDTKDLATKISGTGDPELDVKASYTSPNIDIFGEIDAPPVNDERFKSEETLLSEMKSRLIDEPVVSLTVNFVDLRAAGYPYTQPGEGDRVFVIYEPMDDLLIETRILEITETFNNNLKVTKSEVTLANHKRSFAGTMFDNVQKQLSDIVNDDGVVRYSVLDEAVKVATEALHSAQTELEFNNGIIAREKGDPNRLVLLNSGGIGISDDGGNTFREAITADGFVLTAGAIGRLSANHIQIGAETEFEQGLHPSESSLHVLKSQFESYEQTAQTLLENDTIKKFHIVISLTFDEYESEYNTLVKLIETVIENEDDGINWALFVEYQYDLYNEKLKEFQNVVENARENIAINIDGETREDLRLASPLPTSITMNNDGITAYVPGTNDFSFARLDHRGLYIRGGAIQIDNGLPDRQIESSDRWNTQGTYIDSNGIYTGSITANQVQVGFNNVSSYIKLTWQGLETYDGLDMTSRLDGYGQTFYRNGNRIGGIGTSGWRNDTNYRGLNFRLERKSDYMAWSYLKNDSDDYYTTMLSWHRTSSKDNKGFNFSDDVTFKSGVSFNNGANIKTYTNAIEWAYSTRNHITQYNTGQVQFHMGSSTARHTFYPDGTKMGGSIEIENEVYGMSPVDSPQLLIEYIEFDIELSKNGVKVYLDETYTKSVSAFAVFLNNGTVIEKGNSYFVAVGDGLADARIIGKRIEYEKAFWGDMESAGLKEDDDKPKLRMASSKTNRTKNNWFIENERTMSSENVNGIERKVLTR